METPVLYITDSSFILGTVSHVGYSHTFAAGLSLLAILTTYHVKSYIRNITTYSNTGKLYGNMLFEINHKVAIQVIQANCTGGHYFGFSLELRGDFTNSKSQVTFHMLQSYFGRNTIGVLLYFDSVSNSVSVKLENITVENNDQAFQVLMSHSSVLIMENVIVNHNMGPVFIRNSAVEFHESNSFAENNCTDLIYPVLHLKQCSITFHDNTTFLRNNGRYGGAIYAEKAEINIQGNVVFLKNKGEFVGAVYVRDSVIIIRTGRKLSFVENEGRDGGAMTFVGGSTLYLEANSSVTFVRNHAYHYGGAIYYVDDYTEDFELTADLSKCFSGILNADIQAVFANLKDIFTYIRMTHTSIQLGLLELLFMVVG